MGQKVNPKIFRIGPLFTWDSKWFARKAQFASQLRTDDAIRAFLRKELKAGGVARVEIEWTPHALAVIIHSAKPG
jgi:small subunit ribosomal protein S3